MAYDWKEIEETIKGAILSGEIEPTFAAILKLTNIPLSTLKDRFSKEHNVYSDGLLEWATGKDGWEETDNNSAYSILTSNKPITYDEMVEKFKVDLDIWVAERQITNSWQVGAKNREKQIEVTPLYQTKIWWVRIVPISNRPVLRPYDTPWKAPRTIKAERLGDKIKRALILPDPHFLFARDFDKNTLIPGHDYKALDIALQLAEENWYDEIVWLGDILDLPDWSTKFHRSPKFANTTQDSAHIAYWWLRQVKTAAARLNPDVDVTVMEGNHDKRLLIAIEAHLAAAYDLREAGEESAEPLLSIPRLLGLDKLGIEWVGNYPNGKVWLNPHIAVMHGDKTSLSAISKEAIYTKIIGHLHRIELIEKTQHSYEGTIRTLSFSTGCLCRIDGFVPPEKEENNWQNGVGEVEYTEEDRYANCNSVSIHDGTAIHNGEYLKARDREDEMSEYLERMHSA